MLLSDVRLCGPPNCPLSLNTLIWDACRRIREYQRGYICGRCRQNRELRFEVKDRMAEIYDQMKLAQHFDTDPLQVLLQLRRMANKPLRNA